MAENVKTTGTKFKDYLSHSLCKLLDVILTNRWVERKLDLDGMNKALVDKIFGEGYGGVKITAHPDYVEFYIKGEVVRLPYEV